MTGLRVIGLDLSVAATGLARTHSSDGELRLSCNTLATAQSPLKQRPNTMDHRRVKQIIGYVMKACRMRPDVVAIELPLLVDKGDYSLRAAELHGAIKHWLFCQRIPYVDVHLTHVKMFATGDGNADKPTVHAAMQARYGTLPEPWKGVAVANHNEADALSLLAMTLYAMGEPLADVPETHRRALDSYAWPTAHGGAL